MNEKPPISEKVCEYFCLAFALWTLLCHAVVFSGGNFNQLLIAASVGSTALLGALIAFYLWRRGNPDNRERDRQRGGTSDSAELPSAADPPWMIGIVLVAAAVALFAYPFRTGVVAHWWIAIGILSFAYIRTHPRAPISLAPLGRRAKDERAFWLIAAIALLINLVFHRPDPDDALYINFAVSALDHPALALYSRDTMHEFGDWPLLLAAYRVHSIELLMAVLSFVTRLPPLIGFHVFYAATGAVLVVLAYSYLLRLLLPRNWIWVLAALLVIFFGAGGPQNHWYGNLSLVRIWQGKCTVIHVMIPLAYAFGIRFALAPGLYRWFLLASVQVAAIGFSGSAMWSVPIASCLGMASALPLRWKSLRLLAPGILASSYVVAVGLYIKSQMRPQTDWIENANFKLRDYGAMVESTQRLDAPGVATDFAWTNVLGEGPLRFYALGALMLAWLVCKRPLARRFCVVVPLGVLLFVINPYTERFTMANMTGSTYYRATWVLPLPLLMAVCLTSPIRLAAAGASLRRPLLLVGLLATAYVLTGSRFEAIGPESPLSRVGTVFHPRNRIWPSAPTIRIEKDVLASIQVLRDELPPGSHVVAPFWFSFWFPTFRDQLHPLIVHELYTHMNRRRLPEGDAVRRIQLTNYVGGAEETEVTAEALREGLRHYDILGVALTENAPWIEEIVTVLEQEGFVLKASIEPYQVWVKDVPAVASATGKRRGPSSLGQASLLFDTAQTAIVF